MTRTHALLALPALLLACSNSQEEEPRAPVGRNPIPGLIGEIGVDRDVVDVGETVEATFWIRNRGDETLTADLCASCAEPGRPWRDFWFNSLHVGAPDEYLKLQPPGPEPLVGPIHLPPNERIEFARARFQAIAPGRYRITGEILWTGVDLIEFEPAAVLVLAGRTEGHPGPSVPSGEAEALVAQLAHPDRSRVEAARKELLSRPEIAIPALFAHLADPDEKITGGSVELLIQIGPTVVGEAKRLLADPTGPPDARWRAAFIVAEVAGADAPPILARSARQDPAPEVRKRSMELLARGKGVDHDVAIETFLAALEDGDPEVRADAAKYLEQESGQSHGEDAAAWRAWWEARKREGR